MLNQRSRDLVFVEDPSSYPIPSIEPVHLFSSSRADVVALRPRFFCQWAFASIQLWILIFVLCALYFGAGHDPNSRTHNLNVAVVDFDGDQAGRFFLNAFKSTPSGNQTLYWRYKYPSDYDNNVNETQRDVNNGQVWAIISLRSNTSFALNTSLQALINSTTTLTSPFSTTLPVLVIYEDGRNTYTVNNFILPAIRLAIANATAAYGQSLRAALIANLSSSSSATNNRNVQFENTFQLGSLLSNPLEAQYDNLHPGQPYVGQLATTLGYVYLYLTIGLVVGSGIGIATPLVGKIQVLDLLAFRLFNGVFQSLIIALIYSLIVLWFFGIHSGRQFMRYWMFNWLSTIVLSSIVAVYTINFGVYANFFLIIFVMLMLAGATVQIALELSPRFYRYGYGMPLYNILNGGRHLLFRSHAYFSLGVGILLIYLAVILPLAIITGILWTKRQERKVLAEQQKQKQKKIQNGTKTKVKSVTKK